MLTHPSRLARSLATTLAAGAVTFSLPTAASAASLPQPTDPCSVLGLSCLTQSPSQVEIWCASTICQPQPPSVGPVDPGPVQPIFVSTPDGDVMVNSTSVVSGLISAVEQTTRGVSGPQMVIHSDSAINGWPSPGGLGGCGEAGCAPPRLSPPSTNSPSSSTSSPTGPCPYSDMSGCSNTTSVANYVVRCSSGDCSQIQGGGLFHVLQPTGYDPYSDYVEWGFALDTTIDRKGNCELSNDIFTWDTTTGSAPTLLDYSPRGTNDNGSNSSYSVNAGFDTKNGAYLNFGYSRGWSDSGKLQGEWLDQGEITNARWHTSDTFCPDGPRNVLNAGIWEIPNGDDISYNLSWTSYN